MSDFFLSKSKHRKSDLEAGVPVPVNPASVWVPHDVFHTIWHIFDIKYPSALDLSISHPCLATAIKFIEYLPSSKCAQILCY